MKRSPKTAAVAAITLALSCALIMGLAGCGSASAEAGSANDSVSAESARASVSVSAEAGAEVTVSASASVQLVPDKATVHFGVVTEERNAEQALSRNAEAVQGVIDTLTERGIEERSIRTTHYSLYPQYDYSGSGEPRLTGYVVNTSMSVQDQDIDELGALLSACVAAGINNIDSVTFLCSGYDEAYQQALAQAVADARGKAEALAQAAGRPLGDVATITEGWQDTSARYGRNEAVSFDMEEAASGAARDMGAVLQPGETTITANVTVTFRMG